jgi:hypothetical protein
MLLSTAIMFDMSTQMISKIWKRACQSYEDPFIRCQSSSKKKLWSTVEVQLQCCPRGYCSSSPKAQEIFFTEANRSNWSALSHYTLPFGWNEK